MVLSLNNLALRQGSFDLFADVTIAAGDIVAVIGPSGAGKSTLFDALGGFLKQVSGHIVWEGSKLDALPPGNRPIAMLFQDNNLFPHLTVEQNVALAITTKASLTDDQRKAVQKVLGRVGLEGYGGRRISELSGGQMSRVALARLLLQDRPIWLLDEPFAALGPGLKSEMLGLVAEIAKESGTTVLMITHQPADARRIADLSILVTDGEVTGPFETTSLLDDPPDALRDYLD